MKTMIKWVYLIFGIAIGIWHLYLGTLSIFLFRENENWLSWLMILLGPLLTLPAVLIGVRRPHISSWCLFCGATLSLLSMGISEGLHGDHMLNFAFKISVPMYLLAIMCLIRQAGASPIRKEE